MLPQGVSCCPKQALLASWKSPSDAEGEEEGMRRRMKRKEDRNGTFSYVKDKAKEAYT